MWKYNALRKAVFLPSKICKDESYPLPKVYQGLYNPINRRVERELLPVLRGSDIAFVAYNPLAGGMLTGKHSREDGEVRKGRFHKNKNYSERFYKPDVFDALDKINVACKKADISIIQVCPLPWQVQLMTH